MTARHLNLAILLIALGVIGGVWFFQLVVGLAPCELCLKERLPWYAAIFLAAAALAAPRFGQGRLLQAGFLVLFLGSAGFACYHVAVEQHWIAGPASCTGTLGKGLSIEQLTAQLLATPVVQCDQVQWSLFGISLAGWNVIASFLPIALVARYWWMPAHGK